MIGQHMLCDEVREIMREWEDEVETSAMIRASKEGLSPKIIKAIFRLAKTESDRETATLMFETFGYDRTMDGTPNLCPDTPCLSQRGEHIQYWNDDANSMLLVEEILTGMKVAMMGITIPGLGSIPLGTYAEKVTTPNLYFVGSEEVLDELGADYANVICPNSGEECRQSFKIYKITNISKAFHDRIGDVAPYGKILDEEYKRVRDTYKQRIDDFCKTKCGKVR